jgi:predicted MPP superfamily phosphohydrolase
MRRHGGKLVLVVVALLTLWAFVIEPNQLVLREVPIVLPGWPESLDGMRVALISDLHVGAPFVGERKLAEVVATTNDAAPDIILLLGDYVVGREPGATFVVPERIAPALGGLRARLGVYAVLGNHDWRYDGERVTRAFTRAGLRVLENEVLELHERGQSIWIAGLADSMTRPQDPVGTIGKVGAGPVIAFTHEPDAFPRIPDRATLTVAGHTHGGQVALPLLGRLVVPSRYGQRYAIGHIVENGRHLYVTPGVGTSILPVRFAVPPEITILVLHAPSFVRAIEALPAHP